jgi:hypothetical protein
MIFEAVAGEKQDRLLPFRAGAGQVLGRESTKATCEARKAIDKKAGGKI